MNWSSVVNCSYIQHYNQKPPPKDPNVLFEEVISQIHVVDMWSALLILSNSE
jgi:hypothetical protein